MPFNSADAYRQFAASVKHDKRFIYDERVSAFLSALHETSVSRTVDLPAGSILWRAQLGYQVRIQDAGKPEEMEVEAPYFAERMKPLAQKVTDGRPNPRGIAYLYLASTDNAACSEVRPWLGALVSLSLSQFRIKRPLRIVDCTSDKKRWFKAFDADMTNFIPWEPHEFESVVWGDINEALSQPVIPDESSLSYVPTQIIAEALRHHGADGLAYKSMLSAGGNNFAIFEIKDADPLNNTLYETDKVSYVFSQQC